MWDPQEPRESSSGHTRETYPPCADTGEKGGKRRREGHADRQPGKKIEIKKL